MREADGLAMSSRNVYLSTDDRRNATVLHESLRYAEREIGRRETAVDKIRMAMEGMMGTKGVAVVDYIAFLDPERFREIDVIAVPTVLIALAARFGKTRLIDNVLAKVGIS